MVFMAESGMNKTLKQKKAAKNILKANIVNSATGSTLITMAKNKKWLGRLDSNQQRPG